MEMSPKVRYPDQTDAARAKYPDKRIKRIVMLGPPNQGAELAEELGNNPAFIAVFGVAGQQFVNNLFTFNATPQQTRGAEISGGHHYGGYWYSFAVVDQNTTGVTA